MKTTSNYKLKKPDLTDVADIEVLNSNADILDTVIKGLQNNQFTEQQARQLFALISHKHNTSDINNLTTIIQQTKANSAAYADNAGRANNAINADKLKNMIFNWSGQGGQPPWLWGGSDGTNMYVYDPSNFNVNHANTAGNANNVQGFQFRNNNGQLEVLVGGAWLSVGAKQYTINRNAELKHHLQVFEYSGSSGVVRDISGYYSRVELGSQDSINKFNSNQWLGSCFLVCWIDGVLLNGELCATIRDENSKNHFLTGVEFKHSIKLQFYVRGSSSPVGIHIQTEK